MRISYYDMKKEFIRVFTKYGMSAENAEASATLFVNASLDGVYSHGLNRVPRLINYIKKGFVKLNTIPQKITKLNNIEQYDGICGMGDLNAQYCMKRAIDLANEYGMGLVTIRNTNHWMRGGNFGWQAAKENCIAICWTNTESCMPPWGAKDQKIGNNPLVIAIPNKDNPIVLDMAMSQFSYGKLQVTRLNNQELPVDGGFDTDGNLTKNPAEIEKTMRILPTGYWKGSGLSIVLDLLAGILSHGLSTVDIDKNKPEKTVSCYKASQIFLVINPDKFVEQNFIDKIVKDTIEYLHAAIPMEDGGNVTYPGERTLHVRNENMIKGIPVNEDIWNEVKSL